MSKLRWGILGTGRIAGVFAEGLRSVGDAELVDAVADDLRRPLHVGVLQRPARGWNRLEDDLEAALQVEAQHGRAVERGTGDRQQSRSDQGGQDQRDEDEVVTTLFHREARLG